MSTSSPRHLHLYPLRHVCMCVCVLLLCLQVWGGVMPLSFFPAYCGIVLLAAAAVQKFFVVRVAFLVQLEPHITLAWPNMT